MSHTQRASKGVILLTLLLTLGLLAGGFGQAGAEPHRRADLSRLVVVGDSLSAGYQNGSLLATQQAHGYASLVAAQADVELPLPLIAAPGIPNVLTLDPRTLVIGQASGVSPGRVPSFAEPMNCPFAQPMNLAVPGATVREALEQQPDSDVNSLTDLILGLPGLCAGIARSQVEWAEHLAPTTLIVWIGNVDALGAALVADARALTPVADFEKSYSELLRRLAATRATLVVANIPDVTVIPFLTPAEEVTVGVAAQTGLTEPVVGALLGIGPGDFVIPDAFALIPGILVYGGPLPGHVVLDAGEVAQIRVATSAYNRIIAAQAKKHGAALVNIHRLLDRAQEHGLVIGGRRLTTDYLGGLFSLDGIHPTNTGYAVIANKVIHALNHHFAAGIPRVHVRQVMRDDPLVLPGMGEPADALDDD